MSFLPGFGRSATKPQSAKADTSATTTVAGIEKPTPHLQTVPYTVRVRSSFKGEMIALRTELQAERQNKQGVTRRVTEREMLELSIDDYKSVRRNRGGSACSDRFSALINGTSAEGQAAKRNGSTWRDP